MDIFNLVFLFIGLINCQSRLDHPKNMKKLLKLTLLAFFFININEAKRSSSSKASQIEDSEVAYTTTSKSKRNSNRQQNQMKIKKSKKHKKQGSHHQQQHRIYTWNEPAFWWNTLLAIFLSCAGGFFSGMTVGLNSLDKLTLEVQQITGKQQQKKKAARILNTIKDHHLFLVTLLVGNAMVLEWLPLVVHKVMPDWAAIIMSTIAVVIVAQIVPMSYTTGPSKYKVAYKCAPLVDICIKVYYIIAYPIARGLDKLLGVHDTSHIKRRDFIPFINEKKKNHLQPLQIAIFNQVFVGQQFTSVQKIMTPIKQVFVLSMSDQVTQQIIKQIIHSQISCILVAKNKNQIKNFNLLTAIKTKQFVCSYLKKKSQLKKSSLHLNEFLRPQFVVNPADSAEGHQKGLQNRQAIFNYNHNHKIPVVYSDTGLLDLLDILHQRKASVALVHKQIRRQQNTDIAYLDASDHEVIYDPYSAQDKRSIIGVVMIDHIFQTIADFNGQLTPLFQKRKQDTAPKKRKLVKKPSIVSAYSAMSQRSWAD